MGIVESTTGAPTPPPTCGNPPFWKKCPIWIESAKDYVEGMWRILQADKPDDFVLSTNEFHSVREFIEMSFSMKGFNIKWKGEGLDEIGYDEKTGRELIFISERYFRPAEVEELLGDSIKARTMLGWKPQYSLEN